jgi:ATP-dependent DNA helicase RecQ
VAGTTPLAARAAVDRLADAGVWTVLPSHPHRALVRMTQPAEAVRRYADARENPALRRFARALLRVLPAEAFSGWAEVDLPPMEARLGLGRDRLLAGLGFLAQHGLLAVHPPSEGLRVVFEGPRTEKAALDAGALAAARRRALVRLDEVLRYAGALHCRRQFLLHYFGEPCPPRCGRCDVCLGRHRPAVVTPEDEGRLRRLLGHVERGEPRAAWLAGEGLPPHRRDGLADWLVHEGLLVVEDPLADRLALTPKALRLLRQET